MPALAPNHRVTARTDSHGWARVAAKRTLAPMARAWQTFEAVLFDLDGTLVATDRFWPDAARAGALRAFAAEGLARELPSAEQWMALVGLPLEEGFDQLFADLSPAVRARVLQACVEEEHRLLAEGRAGLLPGVAQALQELSERGLSIGVASNCSQGYLDAMWQGTELRRWVQSARCLHSPGIRNKADMIEELLIEFGTRRALMVGDREGDRQAAWANGLPHAHFTRGYAQPGEPVDAEATLAGMDELLPRMAQRARWVEGALDSLALGDGGVLGVLGAPGSDHAWIAADLAEALGDRGLPVRRVQSEALMRWPSGSESIETHGSEQDPERVARQILPAGEDLQRALSTAESGWTIVHGPLLHQPACLQFLDRILVLRVDPEVAERRVRGTLRAEPKAVREGLEVRMPVLARIETELQDRYPPEAIAHAVLDTSQGLGPGPGDTEPA